MGEPVDPVFLTRLSPAPFEQHAAGERMTQIVHAGSVAVLCPAKAFRQSPKGDADGCVGKTIPGTVNKKEGVPGNRLSRCLA